MPAYYLCSECLEADGVVTRLFRGTSPGSDTYCDPTNSPAFHCPADRGHNRRDSPPILITRVPRDLAIVTWSRGMSRERREELEELTERVHRAVADIFGAFRAIGERRDAGEGLQWTHDKRQALARIPCGWRLHGFS